MGLDESGREKAPLIGRLLRAANQSADDEDGAHGHDDDSAAIQQRLSAATLHALFGEVLQMETAGSFWPAQVTLALSSRKIGVELYMRVIGGTGRNESERRFQNPTTEPAIRVISGRACLLLGLWLEQGMARAVFVAFDAYRRLGKTTRFSLFMPLSLLEQAADTGFATHVTNSGETLHAFRPESLSRYLDAFAKEATWGEDDPGVWVKTTDPRRKDSSPLHRAVSLNADSIEIRPRAGMYAAFARLNYKPWFALAELVDNAVQSHLANIDRLAAVSGVGPLVVDIVVEDDEISVTDRAAGIALRDFPRAFSPATPPPDATDPQRHRPF